MTPTPEAMLHRLVSFCPDFEAYWNDEENLFREKDGSFTLYGLFSEFGDLVRSEFGSMPEAARRELFGFIEGCLIEPGQAPHNDLDDAVCTSFLGNLAAEPTLASQVRGYLGPKSEVFFEFWT